MKKYPIGKPELKNEKEMFIGGYWCPPPTDENYKNAAECGITHMMVNTYIGREKEDEEYYLIPFALARKYGVKVVMHAMNKGWENIKCYKDIFLAQDNFEGIVAEDEPNYSRSEFFVKDYQDFKKDCPNKPYYVNLFPYYASPTAQLGCDTYEEYVSSHVEKVVKQFDERHKILMCDTYPLKNGNKLLEKWLWNIELIKEAGENAGAEVYFYTQDEGFWGGWQQMTTLAELTFQVYVYLAYGVQGLSHYPYLTPPGSKPHEKGIVAEDGRKSFVFPLAKRANELIKKLDGYILDFTWKGVMAKLGTNNAEGFNENFSHCKNMIDGYGVLKNFTTQEDAIIGCFENADGYQGYLITNFSAPIAGKPTVITAEFDGCDKAIVFIQGEPIEVDFVDGKLTQTLGLGEGIFVVPYKG